MNRDLYFNSIKVRLKHGVGREFVNVEHEFQFHKGTIKTLLDALIYPANRNFNSIKVRLKHHVLLYSNVEG